MLCRLVSNFQNIYFLFEGLCDDEERKLVYASLINSKLPDFNFLVR